MLNIQRSSNGQRNAEHDSRFTASHVYEPGRALNFEQQILREVEPRNRVFQGQSAEQKPDQIVRSLPLQLRKDLSFDYMSLVLRKEGADGEVWYVLDDQDSPALTWTQSAPSEEFLMYWVVEHQEAAVIPNFEEQTRFDSWKSCGSRLFLPMQRRCLRAIRGQVMCASCKTSLSGR
jgi:hypothetical protein